MEELKHGSSSSCLSNFGDNLDNWELAEVITKEFTETDIDKETLWCHVKKVLTST